MSSVGKPICAKLCVLLRASSRVSGAGKASTTGDGLICGLHKAVGALFYGLANHDYGHTTLFLTS